ncbi:DUF2889 domain-containing protein [Pelomonas sp. KK5]|uniref:DUF2889 domain-containing protein n=1 Tax=Pelomonas sp. KK5 TaxID=1855730 RepID=UPI00097C30A5|nr:DUF2889 domain-containing protein [Pelomonas sp. KK5]
MGAFRRRIVIAHEGELQRGTARAALEDDFHHFRVAVDHEFEQVLHVEGSALRNPYALCPSAAGPLGALVGMRLDGIASSVGRFTEASLQCTHMFDLAGLAIAAAAKKRPRRKYDIEVPDRVDGCTQARLWADGELLLDWPLDGLLIAGPGVSLREGFSRWALQTLSPDQAEAAIVLRRCAMISMGRQKNLDIQIHAMPTGRCHVQQPERAALALRNVGSTWDFSARAAALCADDEKWLAFE